MSKIGRLLLSSTYNEHGHLVAQVFRVDGGKVHATLANHEWTETFEPDPDPEIALQRENRRATRDVARPNEAEGDSKNGPKL